MAKPAMVVLLALASLGTLAARAAQPEKTPASKPRVYVGSRACEPCHADAYERFLKNAKKARSFAAVQKLQKKLTPAELSGCYSCHTTGFGKPGGFVSLEQTPELAIAGCEVCHGPGSTHASSTSKADILRLPDPSSCGVCHLADRVKAFNYRPVLRAGAH